MAVKGSRYRSMRIIPHRPMMRYVRFFGLLIFCAGFFFAGIYYVRHQQQLVVNNNQLEQQKMAQELTALRTNAEVDRQTIEDMRQLVMTQKVQMGISERYLRVYKELMSSGAKANPLGVSFGLFTVSPLAGEGHFNYKLVVEKLSTQETSFVGSLEFKVIGEQDGKAMTFSQQQISTQLTASSIPLDLKYFQVVEGELQLPLNFVPKMVEIVVKTSERTVIQAQLEWQI